MPGESESSPSVEETKQPLHLLTGHIRDLAHAPLLTCAETTSIQETAQLMNSHRVSAAVILNASGQAVGIVTDWDLRERVVAAGRDTRQPIHQVMSAPLITIPAHAPIYEAVRLMITHNIHHLLITLDQQPLGLVTSHDLIVLHSASAFFTAREIKRQTTAAGLRAVLDQAQQTIPLLLRQGVRASQIGWLMTDINDHLSRRVLELTEASLGPPPLPYCWLVLGSEGRHEQTFKTDQDNALIYADPPQEAADSTHAYFLEFGRQVVASLVEAGFPPCPGRLTADNPLWVQSVSGWQDRFHRWATTWEPEEEFNFLIFFDFRGVYGDLTLPRNLRRYIAKLLDEHPRFLTRLAHLSASLPPPIGFFGQFTVEHNGEHKHEFDLKQRAMVPLVDLARFFALKYHLNETNTLARLEQVQEASDLAADLVHELAQSFEFLLNLRLQHQWEQLQAGQPPSNYLNPSHLSVLERSFLKETFKAIAQAQALLHKMYHLKVGRLY
ncbi:MAG: CBS domain-containing protein [Anaerolineae bacterium]|nr:CBS domain-containing protein [Anaerolineae bacterium]